MPHMAIEPMSVGNLRPYAKNARTHSKKQIKQIARSIERFGFTNPVLISNENEIIAGHGRVEAAKLLGIESVLTLRLSHLTRRSAAPMGSPITSLRRTPVTAGSRQQSSSAARASRRSGCPTSPRPSAAPM